MEVSIAKSANMLRLVLFLGAAVLAGFASSLAHAAETVDTRAPAAKESDAAIAFPKIDRKPGPSQWQKGALSALPKYDANSTRGWQVDVRSAHLRELDLRDSTGDLLFADFDTRTAWPGAERMPADFDPKAVMELGKNPGLGVRSLHERGITGKGVGIAVLDQVLLVDHTEYADRLRLYEEINIRRGSPAAMHGCATASIAAGKTVGAAPESDLYFIGLWSVDPGKPADFKNVNFGYYARAVRRILEINEQLPAERKIRAISMSIGWSPGAIGYEKILAAIDAAKKAGLLVTSSSIEQTHGFAIHGLGRPPMADPDRLESYEPGLFWAKQFPGGVAGGRLLIPMDSRTTASPTGADDHVFYRQGGWSWITPYLAGVYALACQVKPDITPDEFLSLALETGRTMEVRTGDTTTAPMRSVIDPVALIERLEKDVERETSEP